MTLWETTLSQGVRYKEEQRFGKLLCLRVLDTKKNNALGNYSVSECQIQRRTRQFIGTKDSLNKGILNN
jgi:hypothetical protein